MMSMEFKRFDSLIFAFMILKKNHFNGEMQYAKNFWCSSPRILFVEFSGKIYLPTFLALFRHYLSIFSSLKGSKPP